jgi:hypothetical protein
VHPPVSTTIHAPVRTHLPASTSTVQRPPALTSSVPISTTTVHSPVLTSSVPIVTSVPVSTTIARPPVSTTIPTHPSIDIKIVINNIKYSQGISDKQVAHLLENVKFYKEQRDNNNLYRTVLTARLDLIRHYEILVRHLERIERRLREEDAKETDDYDDKLPRHSNNDSTSKYNIIQSMIKLNSRIKDIENSIHFIKGNHKYLLLHILKNLKKQYKKDTMKIFNI